MNLMFPALKMGIPIYAGIIGSHILAVRGAVVDYEGRNIWAICNAPYGTLAGDESNYSKETHREAWYSERIPGKLLSRETRNTNDSSKILGMHVYYNDKTHARTNEKDRFAYFKFNHAHKILNKHNDDITLYNKEFVTKKLVQGDS